MSSTGKQLYNTYATHSPSLTQALDVAWSKLTEGLTYVTSGSLSKFVKSKVLSTLQGVQEGVLIVRTSTETFTFGKEARSTDGRDLRAVIHVRRDTFWARIALFTDLGLAEGYMFGDVDCDDMSLLLQIFIANKQHLTGLDGIMSSILAIGRSLTLYKFMGDLSNSKANISAHYDLGNTMFEAFLSEDMQYSSAIFKDYNEDLKSGIEDRESLHEAQLRKMRNLIKRAQIKPGDRLLEIGTGWGSLSILAAQTVDCTVDTVTLSAEQAELARKRIANAGLSDRITVHYMDFRECRKKPEWAGAFDRLFCIEAIENFGRDFIQDFWSVADWALKPRTGTGVVQVITLPEARSASYEKTSADFCQKWVIFPGGYIPSLCFLLDTMNAGSSGRLTADSVQNIGPHYARTLREWKRQFLRNWDSHISSALVEKYGLGPEELSIFQRKWIYYFDYCEAGFATRYLGDHVITFTREANPIFGCDFDPLSV